MDDIAVRIFNLADAKFKEQQDFAAALGIKPSTVSKWRVGITKSYMRKLPEIAQALGTTGEYLLTGKESSPPSEKSELHRRIDLLTPENAQRLLGYLDSLEAQQEKP